MLSALLLVIGSEQREEERLRTDGAERRDAHFMSVRFVSFLQRYAEVHEACYMFSRCGLAGCDTFGCVDRWYVLLDAFIARRLSPMAGAIGAFIVLDIVVIQRP